MIAVVALLVGGLFGVGVFHLLARDALRLVLGFSLLAGAANVLVLSMGVFGGAAAPFVGDGDAVDPLPQALVLTALVIGFGVQAFLVALVYSIARVRRTVDVDELDELRG